MCTDGAYSYLSRLEQRLEDIETNLAQLRQFQHASQHNIANSATTTTPYQAPMQAPAATDDVVPPQASPQLVSTYSTNTELGEVDTSEDAIDGMGAIKFTDEQDSGYFGPTSNIAFLRHISVAMAQASGQPHAMHTTLSISNTTTDWMRVTRQHGNTNGSSSNRLEDRVNIYALPPRARIWELIDEYFQKTGQLLPFIHEESFRETYFEMKRTNFTKARRTWLGLLNMILAMGCTLTVDGYATAEERIAESDIYYQRANGLLQYLLLVGQYLQGTQKSVQAWTVHGLAITTAFQLGLHSPRTTQGFAAIECEIRKRVWFGCILLDRTLSMTFGRPSIIPEKYVKLELPSASIQVMGQVPDGDVTQRIDAMYFQATIILYNIMYQIIDSCYEQNLGLAKSPPDAEIVSMILNGDRQLDEWRYQTVPALQLRISHAPLSSQDIEQIEVKDKTVARFNMVLSLRFHNLRILNHRPILEKFLDSARAIQGVEAGMMHQVYISSIETCVDSAINIVAIVHNVVLATGWRRDLLGAWNYSLFYSKCLPPASPLTRSCLEASLTVE
ncbi:hypothetical protein LTR46_008082 [Exophiala xenobiotica]|nr:hypothetical protein LTR46_008082 [Exophiala xenobiotica]